jgi:hypothetical protein
VTVTDDEALKLQPGDPLVGVISGRLAVVEMVEVYPAGLGHNIVTRRIGKTAAGHKFPPVVRRSKFYQRLPRPDAPAFHVAADWLDENGHPAAAAHLRRAFPLDGAGGA